MVRVSQIQRACFEKIGNGSAKKGLALYKVNNANWELLVMLNTFLGFMLIFSPLLQRIWNEKILSEPELKITENRSIDLRLKPGVVLGEIIFMLNLAFIGTITIVKYFYG